MKRRWHLFYALALPLTLSTPALAIDVGELSNEFNANGMAFKQKYVGRSVTVTGNAWVINGDVSPEYVSLSAPGGFGGLLICTVSNKAGLDATYPGQAHNRPRYGKGRRSLRHPARAV
jgi:hypothetical protein